MKKIDKEEIKTHASLLVKSILSDIERDRMKKEKWIRARFHANLKDPRPIVFPPPGPYWVSGEGIGYAVIVAYVKTEDQITEYWPEADCIDIHEENTSIQFTSRFPKPDYWVEKE